MGDSLARKVFVFVSNMGSNWTNTIEGRVDLAGLSNVLPVGAAEMLAPHDLGQGLRAWGTKPTAVARISKMNPGDVAFAIRKDRVYLAAEVAWVAREPQPLLARALWGSPDYSYVFFMCNPIIHYRPVGEFLKDMGELGSYVMGFRSSDKAARRLERFGDAREFMEYALRVQTSRNSACSKICEGQDGAHTEYRDGHPQVSAAERAAATVIASTRTLNTAPLPDLHLLACSPQRMKPIT